MFSSSSALIQRLLTSLIPMALIAVLAMFGTAGNLSAAEDTLIEKNESLYNDIYLFKRPDGYYVLAFGAKRLHYIESIVNPNDLMELPVTYTRSMTLAAAYAGQLSSAAMIGLGGGRTAWYLHKSIPELQLTAAELDPSVVKIDEKYLGIKNEDNFQVNVVDGRMFLTRTDKTFDIILVDAYRGPFVPFHLLTREFYQLAKKRLNPGGVVVQNVEPTTMLLDSAVATISNVFANVEFYSGDGNIVVVAYDGPRKELGELKRVATERQAKYKFRYDLSGLLENRFVPKINWSTQALTDDFAPAEYLRAIERHNDKQAK
jgi:spermidine synthase